MKQRYETALVVFAILDAMLFGRFMSHVSFPILGEELPLWWIALQVLRPLFLCSLVVSAFGLALRHNWAFIVSYIQFPFRFAYVLLSFGFLSLIPGLFVSGHKYQPVIVAAMGLECVRLAYTIVIYRRITSG